MLKIIFVFCLGLVIGCTGCGDGNFRVGDDDTGDDRDNDNSIDNSDNSVNYRPEPNEGPEGPDDGMDEPNPDGTNPVCSGDMGVDGPGGFLWKAVSESDGNLAIHFPKEFQRKFLSVSVVVDQIGIAEEGSFSGFANGSRQLFRFDQPGGAYTGRVIAEDVNQTCFWEVSNPQDRQD